MNKYEKMYEDILLACRTGEVVVMQSKDRKYFAVKKELSSDAYNRSAFYKDKQWASMCVNSYVLQPKERFVEFAKHHELEIVETYTPEYDRVPVGTKVLIIKGASEGRILTVRHCTDSGYVLEINSQSSTNVPRSAFTVILPEKEKEELMEEPKTITLDGVEYILTPKQK